LPLDLPVEANGKGGTLRSVLDGKPALLMPVDFHCRVTCGPALSVIGEALSHMTLRAGVDYRLLLLGLNSGVAVADTRDFVDARVRQGALRNAIVRITASADVLSRITSSLGYRYSFDATTQSFAHPLGAVTLTKDGAVTRLLSPLALDADNLRLALVEAGQGRIGSLATRLTLLCYGFDAAHGIYTSNVIGLLRGSGLAIVLALATWLAWLARRSRRGEGAAP
jgi:protein SCO1/2